MEEEYRHRLFQEHDRLFDWLEYLEKMIAAERIGIVFLEPQEIKQIEEMLKSGIQRLKKLEKCLEFNEVTRMPDFQFHEIVRMGLTEFLPEKYRNYKVWIGPVPRQGWTVYALQLQKEGAPYLPEMEIKEYVEQVSNRADAWRMLGKVAQA